MEMPIRKLDEVWTADEQLLGLVHGLWHRQSEADPDLQFYAGYLVVENLELGLDYYVPTDYLAGHDPATGRVMLTVPLRTVLERTWTRMPVFVVRGLGRRELLPDAAAMPETAVTTE